MTQAVVTTFNNQLLNEVGGRLIENYKGYNANRRLAKEYLGKAIVRRFMSGKELYTHYDAIMEECGTQREFSERLGITESMLSNDLRAFKALKEEGIEEADQMIKYLESKNINTNVYEWERLPKILAEPDSYREPDRRKKDEKRLEQIHSEIEDIKVRNEGANPMLAERAGDTLKYGKDVEKHIGTQDVFKSKWRSRDYLDFVKSIGWDYITGQQAKNLDPHHTLIDGGARGPDGKVADVFTIPVNRATHNKIEEGRMKPTRLETAEALVRTMALFITTNMKGDNK